MIFNETEEQEKAYLQQVLNIIHDTTQDGALADLQKRFREILR